MSRDDEELHARADAWFRSVENEAMAIVFYAVEEVQELIQATTTTENALIAGRGELQARLVSRGEQLASEWQQRLQQAGFGPFESRERLEAFIHETSGYLDDEPGASDAEAVRFEVFWHWTHFNREIEERFGVELSDRATVFARYGTIVALHALLERALQDFCRIAQRRRRSKIALEDLARAGRDGFKERVYLEKVHGVEVDPRLWDALGSLVFVRNRIAHSSGRLAGERSARALAAFNATPGLSLRSDPNAPDDSEHGTINVESEFLSHCAQAARALLEALGEALSMWDRLRPVKTSIS